MEKAKEIQKHFDDLMYALLESSFRNVVDKPKSKKNSIDFTITFSLISKKKL